MTHPKQQRLRIAALTVAALGLALTIAGPLIPGGERLTRLSPPDTGHVTILAGGSSTSPREQEAPIYAGTANGEIWRYESGLWHYERLPLNGQPVTVLTGNPQTQPIGTAGGLVNAPPGVNFAQRVTALLPTAAGLLVGNDQGIHCLSSPDVTTSNPSLNVYQLIAQPTSNGNLLHAGSMGAGVHSIPDWQLEQNRSTNWPANNQGLPDNAYVYSFATTQGGKLIAGTKSGLYWQSSPDDRWQTLNAGLDSDRILALLLAPNADAQTQRLWIGADGYLLRADLAESADDLRLTGPAVRVKQPEGPLPFGISAIRPTQTGVMISAGDVYQFGPTRLPGWYWLSIGGILLLLIAGWMLPGRQEDAT